MWRPRLIPCLLLNGRSLVKTTGFADPRYVGDPITAVQIFNEKEVDEVIVLDISATVDGRAPNLDFIESLACECFMPVTYGGGVRSTSTMADLFAIGVEKIALNTALIEEPQLLPDAADRFGAQSIVASIDARESSGGHSAWLRRGSSDLGVSPAAVAQRAQASGAGEILITSIDRDGTRSGFDLALTRSVADAVDIPVIASGGAGSLDDVRRVLVDGRATAAAVGSLVVFHGRHQAVLISFPDREAVRLATELG